MKKPSIKKILDNNPRVNEASLRANRAAIKRIREVSDVRKGYGLAGPDTVKRVRVIDHDFGRKLDLAD